MKFVDILNRIFPLSPELFKHLSTIVKTTTLRRNEYLIKQGEVCKNIYFIKEGLLRWYLMKKGGNEVCTFFMQDNDVVYNIVSFTKQQPSKECIQALEDCTLEYISYEDWQGIFRRFPFFEYHGAVLTAYYCKLEEDRMIVACTPNLLDRYQFSLKHYPEYFERVPDKYIASYLEVSESTLSRLKKMSKQTLSGNIKL